MELTPSLRSVGIDLTPLLPGGANGGAKPFVLALLRHLAQRQPRVSFQAVCRPDALPELASIARDNLHLHPSGTALGLRQRIARRMGRRQGRDIGSTQLLFCPFTAPLLARPGQPVVSTFYDIQFHHYPSFFSDADRAQREQHFQHTCRLATRIAAISDFSRSSALVYGGLDGSRILTIPIELGLAPSSGACEAPPFGLNAGRYLLYPANLWAHKNHELLLTAFAMARAQGLDADLKLVCTGDGVGRLEFLRSVLPNLGLQGSVLFPGFVSDSTLEGLRAHALALIFPSLYEGFGMPIIEAMARGLPVACSQTTATGEVAGDAALTFQPGNPGAVAEAILRLVGDAALRRDLIQRGLLRANAYGDPNRMADRYWTLFNEAFRSCASV